MDFSPFCQLYWVQLAFWLGWEPVSTLWWDSIWLESVHVLCVLPPSLWVYMWISPVCVRHCLLRLIYHLWLLQFFPLPFYIDPWALREGFDENIPFMTECFKVSDSAHCLVVDLCVFPSISGRNFFDEGWMRHWSRILVLVFPWYHSISIFRYTLAVSGMGFTSKSGP